MKRKMRGILRESKLPEQKTEAERTASAHAADRPRRRMLRGDGRGDREGKPWIEKLEEPRSGTGHRKESWVTLRCQQN